MRPPRAPQTPPISRPDGLPTDILYEIYIYIYIYTYIINNVYRYMFDTRIRRCFLFSQRLLCHPNTIACTLSSVFAPQPAVAAFPHSIASCSNGLSSPNGEGTCFFQCRASAALTEFSYIYFCTWVTHPYST